MEQSLDSPIICQRELIYYFLKIGPHQRIVFSTHSAGTTGRTNARNQTLTLTSHLIQKQLRGTWVPQSVKCLTLGFSSGHDVKVMRSSATC